MNTFENLCGIGRKTDCAWPVWTLGRVYNEVRERDADQGTRREVPNVQRL